MPSSRSSSPAPNRPASPETPLGTRSASPKPGSRLRGFGRRMTSAFRRDSRASIADVVLDISPATSRPSTPDISQNLSAPAPKEIVEPAVAAATEAVVDEPTIVAEPESMEMEAEVPAPAPAPESIPEPVHEATPIIDTAVPEPETVESAPEHVPEMTVVSPITEVTEPEEATASINEEEKPVAHTYVLLAFRYRYRPGVRKRDSIRVEPIAMMEEAETETVHDIEHDEAPAPADVTEAPQHDFEEQEPEEEFEYPTTTMPVPELHHQSSTS